MTAACTSSPRTGRPASGPALPSDDTAGLNAGDDRGHHRSREPIAMTHAHLRPCPDCARHVRVSEAGCPFCGGTLTESFRASPRPQAPAVRLTRAALFALGTG